MERPEGRPAAGAAGLAQGDQLQGPADVNLPEWGIFLATLPRKIDCLSHSPRKGAHWRIGGVLHHFDTAEPETSRSRPLANIAQDEGH